MRSSRLLPCTAWDGPPSSDDPSSAASPRPPSETEPCVMLPSDHCDWTRPTLRIDDFPRRSPVPPSPESSTSGARAPARNRREHDPGPDRPRPAATHSWPTEAAHRNPRQFDGVVQGRDGGPLRDPGGRRLDATMSAVLSPPFPSSRERPGERAGIGNGGCEGCQPDRPSSFRWHVMQRVA
jgi:hypothetical protein